MIVSSDQANRSFYPVLIDEFKQITPLYRREKIFGTIYLLFFIFGFLMVLILTVISAYRGDENTLGFAVIFIPLALIPQIITYIGYRVYLAEGVIKIDRNGITIVQRRPHRPWQKITGSILVEDIIKIDIDPPKKERGFVKFYLKNEFNGKNEFLFAKSRIPHFQKFIKFWVESGLDIIPTQTYASSDNEKIVNDAYKMALKEQKKSCIVGFLVFTFFSLIFSLPVIDNRWFMLVATSTVIVGGAAFFYSILRSFLKSSPKEFILSPNQLTIIFQKHSINFDWNIIESINPSKTLRIHLKDGSLIALDNVPSSISLHLSQIFYHK